MQRILQLGNTGGIFSPKKSFGKWRLENGYQNAEYGAILNQMRGARWISSVLIEKQSKINSNFIAQYKVKWRSKENI